MHIYHQEYKYRSEIAGPFTPQLRESCITPRMYVLFDPSPPFKALLTDKSSILTRFFHFYPEPLAFCAAGVGGGGFSGAL